MLQAAPSQERNGRNKCCCNLDIYLPSRHTDYALPYARQRINSSQRAHSDPAGRRPAAGRAEGRAGPAPRPPPEPPKPLGSPRLPPGSLPLLSPHLPGGSAAAVGGAPLRSASARPAAGPGLPPGGRGRRLHPPELGAAGARWGDSGRISSEIPKCNRMAFSEGLHFGHNSPTQQRRVGAGKLPGRKGRGGGGQQAAGHEPGGQGGRGQPGLYQE